MSRIPPNEDDNNDTVSLSHFRGASSDAQKALIAAALSDVDTTAVRRALASHVPHVVVIGTPSHAWSRALADEITEVHDNVSTLAIVELKKDGNLWATEWMQKRIASGKHQVFCSAEPRTLLPAQVHAAADVRLDLPPVTEKLVQRAIGKLTGKTQRKALNLEIGGLDFFDLQLALRPGSSAADCVARLRQAAANAATNPNLVPNIGPALEDLPLSADVGHWAYDTLAQLKDVGAGTLAPDMLRHGVLAGPPGTGKTLLAGALAKSAGWSLHSASIGAWFNSSDGHLGGVSKACVGFFDTLLSGDCVVGFLDEIDSLPSRERLDARDLQWWSTVINLVLTQVDRLRNSNKRVLLLGATNFHDRLDSGLTRFGRLDQRVDVLAPKTADEVSAVLAHFLGSDIDPAELASIVPFALGATPATIAGWVRAARGMARSLKRPLMASDVLTMVAPVDLRSVEELQAVAIHEAGHAVVARAVGIDVEAVSLVSQGSAAGFTRTAPLSTFPNRDELERMVMVFLGGRAADLVLGKKGAHSGAASDLEMATSLLMQGHCQLGLYDTLRRHDQPMDEHGPAIEAALQRLLDATVLVVAGRKMAVLALTNSLMKHRLLTGAQVDALIKPLMKSLSGIVTSASPAAPRKRRSQQDQIKSKKSGAPDDFLA